MNRISSNPHVPSESCRSVNASNSPKPSNLLP